MTYDEIMRECTPNYMHEKNVRVISAETDENGFRTTTFEHYDTNRKMPTFTFGIKHLGNEWRTYDVDWYAEYGVRNWHDEHFASEDEAIAHIASMSDYALAH